MPPVEALNRTWESFSFNKVWWDMSRNWRAASVGHKLSYQGQHSQIPTTLAKPGNHRAARTVLVSPKWQKLTLESIYCQERVGTGKEIIKTWSDLWSMQETAGDSEKWPRIHSTPHYRKQKDLGVFSNDWRAFCLLDTVKDVDMPIWRLKLGQW